MPGPVVLELQNVSFRYGLALSNALCNVNLAVREGETVGIAGATGSGKSTLLYLMAGVIPHYIEGQLEGDVLIRGRRSADLTMGKIVQDVALVGQDPESQLFNLLVRDEVVWGAENRGYPREQITRMFKQTGRLFGIDGLEKRVTYDLSGGQKQRVVIAANYITNPSILLMDCPTSMLDPLGANTVEDAIKTVEARRTTVVLVEHNVDVMVELVNRLIVLDAGQIVVDCPVEEIYSHEPALRRAGVRLPQIVELTVRLAKRGVTFSHKPLGVGAAIPSYGQAVSLAARSRLPETPVPQPAPPEPVLRIRDLDFTYTGPQPIPALRNVNLDIRRGWLTAIVGQNGSGKTTLARCASAYLKPTRGKVTMGQEVVHSMPLQARARRIGYVFQNPDHEIFKETVDSDVAFGPRNLKEPEERYQQKTYTLLSRLGLWDKWDWHPYQLSRGERQRVAIAAIAVMEPEVLIIDEPTTGQDATQAQEIFEFLRWLISEHGVTVIVITHAMDLVASFCDWVVVMRDGSIVLEGTARQVFAQTEVLRQTFLQPPPVCRLSQALGLSPLPLDVDAAEELFWTLSQAGVSG